MRRPIPKGLPVLASVIVAGLCGLGAYTLQACARPRERNVPMRRTVDAPIPGNLPISAAVVASGLCFVGGQFGTDADNRPVGDVEKQTALAIDHLEGVLKRAGTRLDLVVRTNVWLRSLADFDAMNRAYRVRFPSSPPARVTLGASDILFGAAVEIDAVAAMPEGAEAEHP
jgi:2-iminobutanoate/2-iminopropanoate deaminase